MRANVARIEDEMVKLDSNILRYKARLLICETVRNNLGNFSGKKLTKRIDTHIKSLLGDKFKSTYFPGDVTEPAYMYFWENGIPYNDRYPVYFNKSDETFDYSKFQVRMDERIQQHKNDIKKAEAGKVKGKELLEEWNKVVKDLEEIQKELGDIGIFLD